MDATGSGNAAADRSRVATDGAIIDLDASASDTAAVARALEIITPLLIVSVPSAEIPPPRPGKLFWPKPPALLPLTVLFMIVSVPKLRIPPPSLDAELPLTVLLVIVTIPDELAMPPATPKSAGGLPLVLTLSFTTLLTIVSVAVP